MKSTESEQIPRQRSFSPDEGPGDAWYAHEDNSGQASGQHGLLPSERSRNILPIRQDALAETPGQKTSAVAAGTPLEDGTSQPNWGRSALSGDDEVQSMMTLEDVQAHWGQLLAALRAEGHLRLQAFLNSATPQAVDGDVVTLVFPTGYTMHRDQVQANCGLVEDILTKNLGSQVRTRCVLAESRGGPKAPQRSEAQTPRPVPTESQRQMAQVQADITKMQAELNTLQAERVKLRQEVEALQVRKDKLATELQALERRYEEMARRARELEGTTEYLEEKAKTARQQARETQKIQIEVNKLKDTKTQLESQIAELLGRRKELAASIEDIERQKDSSQTSTTRPDWLNDAVGGRTQQ